MAEPTATTRARSSRAGSRCGPTSAPGRSPTTPDGARRSPTCSRCCPYPSGEPHIGHLKNYSVGDAVAHFHRRTGRRVLHPMGYDAFGLPAENHAIKTGQHPRESTERVDRRVPAAVPRVGHLDRLVARVRHPRAALLPLDAVDLPAALRARPGLPQGGRRQLVPERPDRARQRAGHRRALRALRHRGRGRASSSSGSSASPTTPTACSTTSTRSSGPSTSRRCSATGSAAREGAEVTFRCEELGIDYPVFTTRPDTLFGATFFVMAPEHPDVVRLVAGHRARAGGPRRTSTAR